MPCLFIILLPLPHFPFFSASFLHISRYVKFDNARSRTHTFDADRFLEDVHELPSPKLSPEEKLHWMGYLWRFYRLNEILDPHR